MTASRSTVLVIAQHADSTADRVVTELRRRAVRVARVDTADFPSSVRLHGRPDQAASASWLEAAGERIAFESVLSVYRRHPARFGFPAGLSDTERRFATDESVAGWGGLLTAQPWRWLDHPGAVADAAYKPRQISVAAEVGLRVPRTLITNDPDDVRKFAAEIDGPVVYKSLSTGLVVERDELRIVYTTLVDPNEFDALDRAGLAVCCHLFQAWVPKAHDVRLTVVGDHFFPVEVHASSAPGRVDWRSRYDDLSYVPCALPDDVRHSVRAYLRRFGLRYAAFDFSVTPDGDWWFLEANASGQWEWLQDETGLPITEAIADELIGVT